MTVNDLIDKLQQFRDVFGGGDVQVYTPDGLPITEVITYENAVYLADEGEDGGE